MNKKKEKKRKKKKQEQEQEEEATGRNPCAGENTLALPCFFLPLNFFSWALKKDLD